MKNGLVALVALLMLASCIIGKTKFNDADDWIPGSFDPQKGVLLVEKFPFKEKYSVSMQEYLDEHYSGKYEVLDKEIIMKKTGKYADTQKYPFAFLWKVSSSTYGDRGQYMHYDPFGHFYDRTKEKMYSTTENYNNYGKASYRPFFKSIEEYFVKKAENEDKKGKKD